MASHVLSLKNVSLIRQGRNILTDVNFEVGAKDRWVILGPNGAGKTTMMQLAATTIHPTSGDVVVLGKQLGKSDVFEIRSRVGVVSPNLSRSIPYSESVLDTVLTAAFSVTGRWREQYEDLDYARANQVMQQWQVEQFSDRKFGTLSEGERKRVTLARAVMSDPELLLLDEPTSSLDLGSREQLIKLLSQYALSSSAPAIVMVTHHVEEIPPGFTHGALIKSGEIIAQGELSQTITSENLSKLYDLPITVEENAGRFTARAE